MLVKHSITFLPFAGSLSIHVQVHLFEKWPLVNHKGIWDCLFFAVPADGVFLLAACACSALIHGLQSSEDELKNASSAEMLYTLHLSLSIWHSGSEQTASSPLCAERKTGFDLWHFLCSPANKRWRGGDGFTLGLKTLPADFLWGRNM